MGLLAALPGERIAETLYADKSSLGLFEKVRIAAKAFGHWGDILDFYRTKQRADELFDHYQSYPSSPEGFEEWRSERDDLMETVYETTGADHKY
jgi:hypothetical protein